MPRAISSALKDHIAGEATTLCTLWTITRRDGRVFAFTDHDSDLAFAGHTYTAASGYQRTATASDAAFSVDNLDMIGAFDSNALTDQDMSSGLFDFAEVRLSVVNWGDLSQGEIKLRRGYLGEVQSMPSGGFQVEMRGLLQALANSIGELYTPDCRANFGDARCKFDLTTVVSLEAVLSVQADDRTFTMTTARPDLAGQDGMYAYGVVEWQTGANAGRSMEVKSWTAASATAALWLPMDLPIAVGDTFKIVPGCDKLIDTCIGRWNNAVNFRGIPYLPGMDTLLRIGSVNI